jgi:FkbM family methyltransferase
MLDSFRTARGIVRSLRIYYGGRDRRAALDRHYAAFVSPGDLVFDIGAHVGVEPQPALARTLRLLFSRDKAVTIEQAAVGSRHGTLTLRLNLDNPTVSTASEAFIAAARNAPGWEGQAWTGTVTVPMTTLDALIARHGLPRFVKIDVEGFEAEVLAGLAQPVAALSFEFTTIQRDIAGAAIARCAQIGYAGFRGSLGESLAFVHQRPVTAQEMVAWLMTLPDHANSGDIYATL